MTVHSGLARDEIEVEERGSIPVALPRDEEQLLAVLARASAERWRVVPSGLGSKLAWCRPEVAAGEVDLILSTRALDAVLDYVPGDGTLTAQAGCTMANLADVVREGGHRLTPAVPAPTCVTLGGVLSAGHSGPDRLRFGPARHHVLGMRVALADGTVARSGGKLVKNVTGFDLHRLYTGARGTLCVVLEASLRLFPLPARRAVLLSTAETPDPLLRQANELRDRPLDPLAVTLVGGGTVWRLAVFLAGREAQVEAELELAETVLSACEREDDERADERFAALRDAELADGSWPQVGLSGRPSALAATLDALRGHAELSDGMRVLAQPGIATATVHLPAAREADPERQVVLVTDLAARLAEHGTRTRALELAPEVHHALAPRSTTSASHPALAWMERLRAELDPDRRFHCPTFPGRS